MCIILCVVAELCNGSTADSDSVCLGSNPSSATKTRKPPSGVVFCFAVRKDSNEEGEKRTAFFGRKQSGGLFSPNGDKERQRRDRRGSAEKILVPQPKQESHPLGWFFVLL